jgi:hypothetical protein
MTLLVDSTPTQSSLIAHTDHPRSPRSVQCFLFGNTLEDLGTDFNLTHTLARAADDEGGAPPPPSGRRTLTEEGPAQLRRTSFLWLSGLAARGMRGDGGEDQCRPLESLRQDLEVWGPGKD